MIKNKLAILLATLTISITGFAQENFDPNKTIDPNKPYGYIKLNQKEDLFQKAVISENLLKKIQNKYPKFEATEVRYLPDLKLYEIIANTSHSLSYTNEDLTYFIINGELVDGNKFTEVVPERNKKFVANEVKKRSKPEEIQLILGDPNAKNRRNILILTDPDCPFCKNLDKEIHRNMKNDNLTITYIMNPLHELPGHEQAPEKAAILWCAPNKNKAWENWMLVGELPNNSGDCQNPTKEHAAFSRRYQILQTPTIFFDNGYIYQNIQEAGHIRQILDSAGVRPD